MNKNKRSGLSLIELLLVIAIVAILGAITIPFTSSWISKSAVADKTNEVVSFLRSAQSGSISGKAGGPWGVKTEATKAILFQGSTYAGRNTTYDQVITFPSVITATNAEVVFDTLSGNPANAVTITVSSTRKTKTISVSATGTINVN